MRVFNLKQLSRSLTLTEKQRRESTANINNEIFVKVDGLRLLQILLPFEISFNQLKKMVMEEVEKHESFQFETVEQIIDFDRETKKRINRKYQ